MKSTFYLKLILLSVILFASNANADKNILVEPINTDFMVLGEAEGKYSVINRNACFDIARLELKLNPKEKTDIKIISIRFGLAIPKEGTIFSYLSQTEHFPINTTLTQKTPITKSNIQLCAKITEQTKNKKYFLTMEIKIKHPKYGNITTHSHNRDGYINLMPKPNKAFKPTPKSGAV